jgi:hypothetical protein
MRPLASLCAAALLAVIAGCGDDRPAPTASTPKPDWVANPSVDGQFGAVGVASRSLGGTQQTLDQAMANARTELARALSVTVETSYKDAFSATSDWKSKAPGADASQIAHELTENVTRQVSDQVLRGSHRRDLYTDPATGEVYVWMVVERGPALSDAVSDKAQTALRERGLEGVEVSKRLVADLEKKLR